MARTRFAARPPRAPTAWLALLLMLWQVALGAGLFERPMAPVQAAGGGIVICTGHGLGQAPASNGVPSPADRQRPDCPCCLPFALMAGAAIPEAPALAPPDWRGVAFAPPPVFALAPWRTASAPQQPRAPPASV